MTVEHARPLVTIEVIPQPAGKTAVDPVGADGNDPRGRRRRERGHLPDLKEEIDAAWVKVGAGCPMVEARQPGGQFVDRLSEIGSALEHVVGSV